MLHLTRMLPGYWKVRIFGQNVGLWLAVRIFNLHLALRESWSSTWIMFILTKNVSLGAFAIVALALLLVLVDYALSSAISDRIALGSLDWTSLKSQLIQVIHSGLNKFTARNGDYSTFFGTMASAMAAVLALYVGAMGVVTSTSYAAVSSALRALLLRDKVSKAFVNLLLLVFGITVILLLLSAGTAKPGLLAAAILALLVIALLAIGGQITTRAFIFFEPASLLDYLNDELFLWLPHIAAPRRFSGVPSFQVQIRHKCAKLLDVYEDLSVVCRQRYESSGKALSSVSSSAMKVYVRYCKIKQSISTKSKWFTFANHHPSWFTADSARVATAMSMPGQPLQPQESADLFWFEERLTGLLTNLVEPDFNQNRLDNLSDCLVLIGPAMLELGECLLFDEAMYLTKGLRKKYLSLIPDSPSLAQDEPRIRLFVASVECLAKAPSDLAAGLNRCLGSMDAQKFSSAVSKFLRDGKTNIGLPRDVLNILFDFRDNLKFEREVEGLELTPRWFVVSRCAIALAENIESSILGLISYCESEAIALVKDLRTRKQVLCSAQAIQGALQCCSKVSACTYEAQKALRRLKSLYHTPDWNWPELNKDDCARRLTSAWKILIKQYAEVCNELLYIGARDPAYPDYLGHGYGLVSDGCFRAIVTGEADDAEYLFKHIVPISLSGSEWLAGQIDVSEKVLPLVNLELISDAIDLSGYAILYSDLIPNNSSWLRIKRLWDKLLETPSNPNALKLLLIAAENHGTNFEMSMRARSHARFNWQRHLQADLQKLGLRHEILGHTHDESPFAKKSESCIVDAVVRSAGISPNVGTLFGAEYLLKRARSESLAVDTNLDRLIHLEKMIENNIKDKRDRLIRQRLERSLRRLTLRIRRETVALSRSRHASRYSRRQKESTLRRLKSFRKRILWRLSTHEQTKKSTFWDFL